MSSPAHPDGLSSCVPTPPFRSTRVRNDLRAYVPEFPFDTQCLRRVDVSSAGGPSFVTTGGTLPADPPVWATALGVDTISLARAGMSIQVAGDARENVGLIQDVLETAVSLGTQAIDDLYWAAWCASPPPLAVGPGLQTYGLLNPTGFIDFAAAALTLDRLAQLLRHTTWRTPATRLVFAMHSRIYEGLEAAARAAQTPIAMLPLGPEGQWVPAFQNIPIAQVDHISLAETVAPDTSSVYLLRLGDADVADGVRGLFVGAPRGRSGVQRGAMEPTSDGADVVEVALWRDAALVALSGDAVVVGRRVLVV